MRFHRMHHGTWSSRCRGAARSSPRWRSATPLTPFIDLQEKGLTLAGDGEGLVGWAGGPAT